MRICSLRYRGSAPAFDFDQQTHRLIGQWLDPCGDQRLDGSTLVILSFLPSTR